MFEALRQKLACHPLVSWLDLLARIIQSGSAAKWKRAKINRYQSCRLQDILTHVLTHSRFYQELYRQHGISLKNVHEIALEDLPIIEKSLMMDNFDQFVCDSRLNKKELEAFVQEPSNMGKKFKKCFTVMHTSGSTGRIGIFAYDVHAWNITKSLAITRVSRTTINPFRRNKLAFIGAADGLYAGISLVSDAPAFLYRLKAFSVCRPWDEILERFQAFNPDTISGYSSSIYMLAQEQLKGRLRVHPERIICSADQLTDHMRQTIENAFGIKPVNFYASSESLCMAAECHLHDGLHMNEDWHIFEVEDGYRNHMRYGNLVLTTLFNRAQPLIRYRMDDHVTITSRPCRCGSAYHRIKNIGGRSEDFLYFKLAEGKTGFIHPSEIVEFFVPGLEKFQLRQISPLHLHMLMVISGSRATVEDAAHRRMKRLLESSGLEKYVKFTTECVKEIPLDEKTGKFRLIIPYNHQAGTDE